MIVNEFGASRIGFSESERTAYLAGPMIHEGSCFKYDIRCEYTTDGAHASIRIHLFFDITRKHCLIARVNPFMTHIDDRYHCTIITFWIEEDLPHFGTRYFEHQPHVVDAIADDFRMKYGAIVLDGIINS